MMIKNIQDREIERGVCERGERGPKVEERGIKKVRLLSSFNIHSVKSDVFEIYKI